ncbi:MAG TPA: hypothetical protein VKX96_08955 [Chloroflexota bacterium]|nr:hypothetical protein [Chloroflexota bacterium]
MITVLPEVLAGAVATAVTVGAAVGTLAGWAGALVGWAAVELEGALVGAAAWTGGLVGVGDAVPEQALRSAPTHPRVETVKKERRVMHSIEKFSFPLTGETLHPPVHSVRQSLLPL